MNGTEYIDLDWPDPEQLKPTLLELEEAWPAIAAALAREVVRAARQAAYIAQTDGMGWKVQRGEVEMTDWIDAVEVIRAAHPYPLEEEFMVTHPDPEA